MEIGLELLDLRFHRPGCYRLAVICQSGQQRLVHVSEASEISMTPKWNTRGWRARIPKGEELQLQLRLYDGFVQDTSHDCRSVLEAAPLSSCSFTLGKSLQDLLPSSQLLSAPLFQAPDKLDKAPRDNFWEELGAATISICLPLSSFVASHLVESFATF